MSGEKKRAADVMNETEAEEEGRKTFELNYYV